jgi:hypothetical protein
MDSERRAATRGEREVGNPPARGSGHLQKGVCVYCHRIQPVRPNDYGWISLCKGSIHDAFEAAEEKLGELFKFRKDR